MPYEEEDTSVIRKKRWSGQVCILLLIWPACILLLIWHACILLLY